MTRTDLETQTPAAVRLRTAWGLAAAGSLLLAVGPLLGVVRGPAPAFGSWPLLALLALLPPVVAGAFLLRGRQFVAAAVLAAVGVFAAGRLFGDLQIAADALAVARPELFRPTSLDPLAAAPGLWLLVLGHVLVLAGGVMAAGRLGVPVEDGDRSKHLAWFVSIAAIGAFGLLGDTYTSTDPLLLARSVWDLPPLGLIGGGLVALAAPLAAALAGSSADPDTRRGGLIGTALAIVAVATPALVASSVADGLGVSWAPVVALIAAAGLVAVSFLDKSGNKSDEEEKAATEVELPTLNRMHAAAGVFAVLAAALAICGALGPQLTVVVGEAPEIYSARLIWPAGVALGVLGLVMFARGAAGAVRPALIMAVYAVQLSAAATVQSVIAAGESGLAQPGLGFWLVVVESLPGAIALVCAAVAGAMEREATEPRKREQLPLPELAAVLLAGMFAVGAFALPTMTGDGDFKAPSVITNFEPVASSSLLASALILVAALVVAVRSRPERGAGLLFGGALLVGVRALELPLTGARVPGAVAGPGTWLALAAVVALMAAAGLMAARATR